ncbi:MAG TPA: ATP-binding cassette domain-containing protein, partial [Hyphomicrobiaceae bacterium]|nr:ATP-binding cassette domain-containing protein [Hyphomicrobiaceae bacterium]
MLTVTNLRTAFVGPASFTVQTGGCLAISGPSGSGKTLLLRAIADLDPNDGEISWDGRSRDAMQAPAWREIVGFVPAETGWWADKVAAHFPPSPERGDSEIEALIVELGLPVLALDWDVNRLSTGERHRLGLVRALLK